MKLTKERNIRANGTPNKTYNQGKAPLPHNGPINKERLKFKYSVVNPKSTYRIRYRKFFSGDSWSRVVLVLLISAVA